MTVPLFIQLLLIVHYYEITTNAISILSLLDADEGVQINFGRQVSVNIEEG